MRLSRIARYGRSHPVARCRQVVSTTGARAAPARGSPAQRVGKAPTRRAQLPDTSRRAASGALRGGPDNKPSSWTLSACARLLRSHDAPRSRTRPTPRRRSSNRGDGSHADFPVLAAVDHKDVWAPFSESNLVSQSDPPTAPVSLGTIRPAGAGSSTAAAPQPRQWL